MALAPQIQGLPANQAIGEVILAVLGIEPLITKPRPLTQEQRRQIVRLPDTIRRATKRAMISSEDGGKEDPSDFDFKAVNGMLAKVGPGTLKEILRVLPPDVGPVTETVLGRVLDFLHQQLPRHVTSSMFGDDVRPGAPNEMRAYARLWEVANDPLVVLNDLAHDRLKLDRVAALETLYPALYQLVLASVTSAISATKGDRPKWQPESAKRKQIEMLTQAQDPGGLGTVMDAVWQAEKEPPSGASAPAQSVQAGKNVATAGQSTGAA